MLDALLLMGVLTGILLGVGFLFFGVVGMTIALVFAVFINFFSYWYSDSIVLRMYNAKPSNDEKLNSIIRKLSMEAKIPKPRIYTVHTSVPNAFATGRDPAHAAVVVTKGLLELNDDEIEGVLAHEIAHIKHRDILVSTLAATIAGAIAYLAQIGYWSLFFGDNRRNDGNLLGFVLIIIFAPLAALLIRLAISRSREYRADRAGAVISKKPRALASALKKISETSLHNPMHGSSATSHLWIVNPFRQDWFSNLFSTHPPVHERIKKLMEMEID